MRKLSGHLIYSSFTPSSSHHAHLNYFPTPPPLSTFDGEGASALPPWLHHWMRCLLLEIQKVAKR